MGCFEFSQLSAGFDGAMINGSKPVFVSDWSRKEMLVVCWLTDPFLLINDMMHILKNKHFLSIFHFDCPRQII